MTGRTRPDRNPDAFRPDLAMPLGMMGRVLEGNNRAEEAIASFHEGIEVLLPRLRAIPQAFATLMSMLVGDYLRVAEAAKREPDRGLLDPVQELLQSLRESEGEEHSD